jgi:hypothetical protein
LRERGGGFSGSAQEGLQSLLMEIEAGDANETLRGSFVSFFRIAHSYRSSASFAATSTTFD